MDALPATNPKLAEAVPVGATAPTFRAAAVGKLLPAPVGLPEHFFLLRDAEWWPPSRRGCNLAAATFNQYSIFLVPDL